MKSIVTILAVLLVAPQLATAERPSVDVLGQEVDPDAVTIIAYRPKKLGGSRTPIMLQMTDLDGTVVLKHKTYYVLKTDLDGPFEFNAEIREYPGDFEIFTEIGNVYYVRCYFNDKKIVARPGFELVDEETARKEMKKLKPAGLL